MENKSNNENNDEILNLYSEEGKEIINDEVISDKITNINILSLNNLINLMNSKEYEYVLITPNENIAELVFGKNNKNIEQENINFPIYTKILLKAKSSLGLDLEITNEEQEGTGKIQIEEKYYEVNIKTTPSNNGEKIWIGIKEIVDNNKNSETKKVSIGKLFGFLGVTALVALIVGGAFLTFVVLNAKTINDVQFFRNLGIDLDQINRFIVSLTTFIFSILVFIETIFLIIFLFKFFLTKKTLRKRKIKYGIISLLILIITFSTASSWIYIDQKVKLLPDWYQLSKGKIQMYDNGKLKSDFFNNDESLIVDSTNLIGPITIKYDLTFLANDRKNNGFKINKFIWNFGDGDITTLTPEIIHKFDEKGIYNATLYLDETNLVGEKSLNKIDEFPLVEIKNIVNINEVNLDNGGKIIELDASDLSQQGKIEWYLEDSPDKPVKKGETLKLPNAIFKETLIGMNIITSENDTTIDKIFIIEGEKENNINGEIVATQSKLNELEFEFYVKDPTNDFGDGFIKEFKWIIGGKTILNKGDITDEQGSSKINFTFENYGEQEVLVELKDSSGNTKIIKTNVVITKKLKLAQNLNITLENGDNIENMKYDNNNYEYYINNLPIPTKLNLDARFVRSDDPLYVIDNIKWDLNNDGNIDSEKKQESVKIDTAGKHIITVEYTFIHRKIQNASIVFKESIIIEGVKKESLLDLQIIKESDYVPIVIGFDASKSQVKGENIVKFIWDFGDGTQIQEVADSIIKGHRYTQAGDYTIKLTVKTETGKEYSIEKNIILNPKPQIAKIKTSLKEAPINQLIDFSSVDSEGQITSYLWDFNDGTKTSEANPSHSFKKAGIYKVKLSIDFSNRNVDTDEIDIRIYE